MGVFTRERKEQTSIRLTYRGKQMVQDLAESMGLTHTAIIEMAIHNLHNCIRRRRLELTPDEPGVRNDPEPLEDSPEAPGMAWELKLDESGMPARREVKTHPVDTDPNKPIFNREYPSKRAESKRVQEHRPGPKPKPKPTVVDLPPGVNQRRTPGANHQKSNPGREVQILSWAKTDRPEIVYGTQVWISGYSLRTSCEHPIWVPEEEFDFANPPATVLCTACTNAKWSKL